MEKPKKPVKIIEFDKTTAQLHVRVETEGNLISVKDKTIKTGNSKSTLVQTIFKNGIKELLESLKEQRAKHVEGASRAKVMMDAENTAIEMIDTDLKSVKDAIGDLKFEEKNESKPVKPIEPAK